MDEDQARNRTDRGPQDLALLPRRGDVPSNVEEGGAALLALSR